MNGFYPNGVASWNIIIKHFDTIPSISKLKEHLLSLFRPNIKSTFNIYDPIGLRCIFQLRLRLSPLRSYKWRHNFIETTTGLSQWLERLENDMYFPSFLGVGWKSIPFFTPPPPPLPLVPCPPSRENPV